jgi:predicted MFS family arabinose efflux permease
MSGTETFILIAIGIAAAAGYFIYSRYADMREKEKSFALAVEMLKTATDLLNNNLYFRTFPLPMAG